MKTVLPSEADPYRDLPVRTQCLHHHSVMPNPESLKFVRALGVDHRTLAACAGAISVMPCCFYADDTFEPVMSAVIEVLGADGHTALDVCAWPLEHPDRFTTADGLADALGIGNVENPATYFGGRPLQVYRTPLRWLQAGGQGVVILNRDSAPRWLGAAPGCIAAADAEHARELGRLLHPFISSKRILAPRTVKEAA